MLCQSWHPIGDLDVFGCRLLDVDRRLEVVGCWWLVVERVVDCYRSRVVCCLSAVVGGCYAVLESDVAGVGELAEHYDSTVDLDRIGQMIKFVSWCKSHRCG